MTLIATLVVGSNNATSKGGQSSPLSTPADRRRFLALHRRASAIITGSKSARVEDYSQTRVPIFVFTRNSAKLDLPHPMMEQVTVSQNLAEEVRRIAERVTGDVIIESGVALLLPLIEVGAVDQLALSISPVAGDGDFIDVAKLLSHFSVVKDDTIDGTRLLECRYNGNSTHS
jgi:riboflavin biosynthesis pyrimidine reductase